MNILYITKYSLMHGGVYQVLKKLQHELKQYKINVILATSSLEIDPNIDKAFCCKIYSKKKLDFLRNTKKINALINKYKIDLIHAHGYTSPSLSAYKLSKKYKIPYICSSHGEINRYTKKNHSIEKEYKKALDASNYITVLNNSALKTARMAGIQNSNCKIIPNGVNERKLNIGNNNYILSFTDFSKNKRSDLIVEGYLNSKKRHKYGLVLAGTGVLSDDFVDKYRLSNVTIHKDKNHLIQTKPNSLYLPGYIRGKDKQHLLDKCSCYAAASEAEGFGVAILEAAYSRKKLILSDIPAFREFSFEFDSDVVKKQTADAWTKAFNALTTSTHKTNFPEKYLWHHIAKEYADLYQLVFNKHHV